jgi:transcriptional regulator with XRE-family HTH domain
MAFRETLQQLREKAGLSQAGLAQKSGVPVRTIQNWEIGHRVPRAESFMALAKALEVPVETLLDELAKDAEVAKRNQRHRRCKLG